MIRTPDGIEFVANHRNPCRCIIDVPSRTEENQYSIQCLRAFDSTIDKVTRAITCRRWYHLERRYIRFPGTHNGDPDVPLNRMQIPGEQWNANDRIDVREKSVLGRVLERFLDVATDPRDL